jgi:hypothetical protein
MKRDGQATTGEETEEGSWKSENNFFGKVEEL